ncbi:MAG: TlyA family RNA methyltransferase [Oscillospiraceae bacterium]|nr:TlyA family RNA methyltransferase [Oscillospiraceae bacterium]
MRLDVFLHEKNYAESRNKAADLITNGSVKINGAVVTKPSANVSDDCEIEIISRLQYVGKAAHKLETAAEIFGISFAGLTCLDAGASTGGFTDFMLQKGAKKIYAVDVGENQLHKSLRENPRVVGIEKQDIRSLKLPEKVDFITADLSFISLTKVLPYFRDFIKPGAGSAVLIKPQFEVGRIAKSRMKNGVLTDMKLVQKTVKKVEEFTQNLGCEIIGTVPSKLNQKGKNSEFICYFKWG